MINKTCNSCGNDKPLTEYNKAKENKDGHNNQCKICRSLYNKQLREKNKYKDKIIIDGKICTKCKNYKLIDNFTKQFSSNDGHRPNCKKCQSEKGKIYVANNKDKIKQYRLDNKDKINKQIQHRRNNDPNYKLRCALRTRLWNAINYGYKSGSSVNDLGCTISEFKEYLESKFTDGMSWDNWSRHGWHIDHIKPLSKFNLLDRNELLKAIHYTNMQPMWAKDNLSKGNTD